MAYPRRAYTPLAVALASVAAGMAIAASVAPAPLYLPLEWDAAPTSPPPWDSLIILGTNSLATPPISQVWQTNVQGSQTFLSASWQINWPIVATVPGTATNYDLLIQPGAMFLTLIGSNVWGYTSNSNVLQLPDATSAAGFKARGKAHL